MKQKLSPTAGGSYIQGQYSYPAQVQGGMVAPSGMLPYYAPFYHYQHHQSQGLGVPAAHFFPPVNATAMATIPTLMPKPAVLAPKGIVQLIYLIHVCQFSETENENMMEQINWLTCIKFRGQQFWARFNRNH